MKIRFSWLLVLVLGISSCSGGKYYFRNTYQKSTELLHDSISNPNNKFLKAHMKNGELYVFQNTWQIDEQKSIISGVGQRYSYNRKLIDGGQFVLQLDSIAIFETNKKLERTESGRAAALGILAGLNVIGTLLCISNPKACYGSCPTFYDQPDVTFHDANAEGFSNAVVPSLEYTDIDALKTTARGEHVFSLWMKNEALETHCINTANIIAVERLPGTFNLHGVNDTFYACRNSIPVAKAITSDGNDIAELIADSDLVEYRGQSDSTDLSTKEEIYLTFEASGSNAQLGLELTYRQSLLVTYLFYSVMGYMGDNVSELFADLETKPEYMERVNNGVKKLLGNIEVYAWDDQSNTWKHQGYFYEEGPIARNQQVLPLTVTGEHIQLKLIVTKGFWKLDQCNLTEIISAQTPKLIQPSALISESGNTATGLSQLLNDTERLISLPGDVWEIQYKMPSGIAEYDVFLASTGYYLEWMREHWIKDKDISKVYQMLYQPKKFLRAEAPIYKANEAQMEQDFWNSRIDTKSVSYD